MATQKLQPPELVKTLAGAPKNGIHWTGKSAPKGSQPKGKK